MTTWTNPNGENDVRLKLACELSELARQKDHKVFVAEKFYHHNDDAVRKLMRAGAQVSHQSGNTVGDQRRHLFQNALDFLTRNAERFDGVLWTEEKPYMAGALDAIIEHMRSRKAPMLIPGRSERSFKTWPKLNQGSEAAGNTSFNMLFGSSEDGDYDPMHGPAYFGIEAIEDVLHFNPTEYGLEDTYIQQYVPIMLLARQIKVASLALDCVYPANQLQEEEGSKFPEMLEKRVRQLKQITDGHLKLYRTLFTKAA